MGMKVKLDQILSAATKQGDVPGVVATVGNREGVLYEAAFGERCLGAGLTMNVDNVWWIDCLYDQGYYISCCCTVR